MTDDLGMDSDQYSISLIVFFITVRMPTVFHMALGTAIRKD